TGTVIVQEAPVPGRPATVIVFVPAVAVTVPPVHVPPTAPVPTTRPAGSVSVKLKVCAGLVAGCEIVKVSVVVPATVSAPLNDLSSVGTAAVTFTHCGVTPLVRRVRPPTAALVLAAIGHAPTLGVADVVTSTRISQLATPTFIAALVTVITPPGAER